MGFFVAILRPLIAIGSEVKFKLATLIAQLMARLTDHHALTIVTDWITSNSQRQLKWSKVNKETRGIVELERRFTTMRRINKRRRQIYPVGPLGENGAKEEVGGAVNVDTAWQVDGRNTACTDDLIVNKSVTQIADDNAA